MSEQQNTEKAKRTFTEEVEVAGNQAVSKVQELIKQGNVRRLIIRTQEGRVLLDTSLTIGVGIGGAMLVLGNIPFLMLAGAAALLIKVKIEVVREVGEGDIVESKQKVEIKVDEE